MLLGTTVGKSLATLRAKAILFLLQSMAYAVEKYHACNWTTSIGGKRRSWLTTPKGED